MGVGATFAGYAEHVQEFHSDLWAGYARAVGSNTIAVVRFMDQFNSAIRDLGEAGMAPSDVANLINATGTFAILGMGEPCSCGSRVVPLRGDEPGDEEGVPDPGGSVGGGSHE